MATGGAGSAPATAEMPATYAGEWHCDLKRSDCMFACCCKTLTVRPFFYVASCHYICCSAIFPHRGTFGFSFAAVISPFLSEMGVPWIFRKLADNGKVSWTITPVAGGFNQKVVNAMRKTDTTYLVSICCLHGLFVHQLYVRLTSLRWPCAPVGSCLLVRDFIAASASASISPCDCSSTLQWRSRIPMAPRTTSR